jgi:S1-C subfamily serine protease
MVDDLMKYGEVHRGTIGGIVTIDRLTPQTAEELGVNSTSGAVVTKMQRASAAYDVGIRPGDVIVRFNSTAIEDPSQLYRLVADARVGSDATIRVLRSGRSMDFKVPIVSDSRGRP